MWCVCAQTLSLSRFERVCGADVPPASACRLRTNSVPQARRLRGLNRHGFDGGSLCWCRRSAGLAGDRSRRRGGARVGGLDGSDGWWWFVPGGAGGRVVAESPVALVGGLWGDVEGVSDLTPGRTPVDGAGDGEGGPLFEVSGLAGQIPGGGQRQSLLILVHTRQLWLMNVTAVNESRRQISQFTDLRRRHEGRFQEAVLRQLRQPSSISEIGLAARIIRTCRALTRRRRRSPGLQLSHRNSRVQPCVTSRAGEFQHPFLRRTRSPDR